MNENNQEILKFNIERATEILRLLENRRKKFLDINLALASAFGVVTGVLFPIFDICGKISVAIAILVYFLITIINIGYNLLNHTTSDIEPSLCFFRNYDWSKYNEYIFKEDYKTQIMNIHKYQENYDNLAKKTRCITLIGALFLFILFSISIIIGVIEISP